MSQYPTALVAPLTAHARAELARVEAERRTAPRHAVMMEALSRPLDGMDTIWWGATVRDLSATGIGLVLCYPFRAGAYLAVDLQGKQGGSRTMLARVVHVRDQADGTWHVGCEFVKRLTDSDVDIMI